MPADLDKVFKAYDVRGVYPDELDEDLARAVGRAFVTLTGAESIAVGYDMRPSSVPMADALTDGATSQGADVVRVGLCSTDMLYFVSGALDVPGVMLTASHNPARYNGLKLCRAGAVPVGEESGLRDLERMVAAGEPATQADRPGTAADGEDLLARYAKHVRGFVDEGALRPLKLVVDAGNGMAGHVLPAVFDGLPFELDPMYFELDGSFPNHPADPINPANLADLRARVVATGADLGLAFDGDADRVFLVDDQGGVVPSSLVVALVARMMCERERGATVLYNIICSHVVPETVREAGGKPVRTRVGHSFIKKVMADTGAIFGGEHSGHYYFRDNYRADSGLIAALVTLEVLCRAGKPLSEVLAPYRRYADSGEVNRRVEGDPKAVVARVAERYPPERRDLTDGLTIEGDGWWFNLRPSNTEPLLRLNVEAATEAEMERVREEILEAVGGEPA
ncbi:MAG TPA: phosphomannomutase/phosphoglucomutase [Actinomycetes bacterium]|nr:phosphomannomutase/phosphoglucomutase [Actinomycetes bacterium]